MKRRGFLALLIVATMTLTTACGDSDSASYGTESVGNSAKSFMADSEEGWSDNSASLELADEAVEAPTPSSQSEVDLEGYDLSRKIVYSSSIGIESKKFDEDVKTIKGLISSNGGYVENSSQYGSAENGDRDCRFTVRVPSKNYDAFMNAVGSVGSMTSKYENVDDITSEYVDVQARLKSLDTKMERLRELEEKAETVEELLQIEDRINDVQYQIESYTAQKRVYDDKVDYSTVEIDINEVATFTEVKADTFWNRFTEAIADSFASFMAFLQGFVIALVYILPYLIVVGVVALIVLLCNRKKLAEHRKIRKQKKTGKPVTPNQNGTYTGPVYDNEEKK